MNKTTKQTLLSTWLRREMAPVVLNEDKPDVSHVGKRKIEELELEESEKKLDDSLQRREKGADVDHSARPERENEKSPAAAVATAPPSTRDDVEETEIFARTQEGVGEEEYGKEANTTVPAAPTSRDDGDQGGEGEHSDDDADADGLTDYERQRERLIARNREALAALGVASAARALSLSGGGGDVAKKQRRVGGASSSNGSQRRAARAAASAAVREEAAARRSSLRPRRGQAGGATVDAGSAATAAAVAPRPRSPTPEPETYENRIVLNYMIDRDGRGGDVGGREVAAASVHARDDDGNKGASVDDDDAPPPSSLRRLPFVLAGPVVKAYSVSASSCGSLLVAGGKDGWAAIWGIRGLKEEAKRGRRSLSDDDDDDRNDDGGGERAPLLSARLHRSWIADVALLSRRTRTDGQENFSAAAQAPLLLTASNDGTLAVHDSGSAAEAAEGKSGGSCSSFAAGAPRRVAGATPHGGSGIFSMSVLEEEDSPCSDRFDVATASKDGSVVVSRVTDDGGGRTEAAATIGDAHGGSVVKCVRWRDRSTLASCGNDGAVRLWDVRCPFGGGGGGAASLEIARATVGGVAANVIRWRGRGSGSGASPPLPHHLLVAGTSPEALVFDVRRPSGTSSSSPMLTLKPPPPPAGKASSSSSVIYQPCYVGGGRGGLSRAIAVGLPRSRVVSLFCADTGAPLSRGDVGGHDASTLQSFRASSREGLGGTKGEVVAAVGTRCLHLFEAV